jgi:hypothetical protein
MNETPQSTNVEIMRLDSNSDFLLTGLPPNRLFRNDRAAEWDIEIVGIIRKRMQQ